MTAIKSAILNRKIGAFEVLVGLVALEVIFLSFFRVVLFGALAVVFYVAKNHFKGEFSLSQLFEATSKPTEKTNT
jgi:hypothetical protein